MKRLMSILIAATFALISGAASAAMVAAFIESERGVIEGENIANGPTATIAILAFGTEIEQATTDPRLGTNLTIGPITLTKNIDKATPKLIQALVLKDSLRRVEIRFFRATTDTKPYFTMRMDNALLTGMRTEGNAQVANGVKETITIEWLERMRLIYVDDGGRVTEYEVIRPDGRL